MTSERTAVALATVREALSYVRDQGMCGDVSPDGERVCIREVGHTDPHPWDSSERTADADAAVGEYEADQYVHVYRRPDAVQHCPPEGVRTADADEATIREVLLIEKGLAVTSSFHDPALAALDRLMARNQQLQEALTAVRTWIAQEEEVGVFVPDLVYAIIDAALASVRARTPA